MTDLGVIFAIPSYKRSWEQLTLDYLERLGVPREKIVMGLQTEEDIAAYRKAGITDRVGRIVYGPGDCCAANRNNLLNALPEGAFVVLMDDDIKTMVKAEGEKISPVNTYEEFMSIIVKGFRTAFRNSTVAFGFYPTDNAGWMSDSITLRTIVDGQIFGLINSGLRFDPAFKTKDDYEISCRIIQEYGALPRLNMYAVRAKSRSKGGCEEAWADNEGRFWAASEILRRYPDILRPNPRRPGEVLMRRSARGATC